MSSQSADAPRPDDDIDLKASSLRRLTEGDLRAQGSLRSLYALMGVNGEELVEMSLRVLHLVQNAQGNKCPVTRVPFTTVDHEGDKNAPKYSEWVTKLTSRRRCGCPWPVRPDPESPWSIGNLVLVSEPIARLYEGLDDPEALVPEMVKIKSLSARKVLMRVLTKNSVRRK